ncbi:MAG: pyrimidine-nucleoside phosphorylase [Clostridiaceae bacterium]|nr:pyrimidine-nucleoside phosphorylase [Clostridiaceae bacterium]
MRVYDIIAKKRDGLELSKEEIYFWVKGYTSGEIPDYQISALLMAIFLNGMSKRETIDLTMAMVESGNTLDLSEIDGIKADKHSTGGVGDKTTLVLCPLVASAGIIIAKMSGRGLGHTGGTVDKLESIPGFNTQMNVKQFLECVKRAGIAIVGQTENLVPADKKIYSLRDVTATVNSIPLIASSIMSKKIAAGCDGILLDVKVGSGAFMKELDKACELAREMVEIGVGLGKSVTAVISNMNQPLGNAVGNSLEVIEAIETLKGKGPEDLTELCLTLGSHLLKTVNKTKTLEEGRQILIEKLHTGKALEKFCEMVENQGGDTKVIWNYGLLPHANYSLDVIAEADGYVQHMNCEQIGIAALESGAGRITKDSIIDLGSGIMLHKKVGERVSKGDIIATVYTNDEEKLRDICRRVKSSYHIADESVPMTRLIYGVVDSQGIHKDFE